MAELRQNEDVNSPETNRTLWKVSKSADASNTSLQFKNDRDASWNTVLGRKIIGFEYTEGKSSINLFYLTTDGDEAKPDPSRANLRTVSLPKDAEDNLVDLAALPGCEGESYLRGLAESKASPVRLQIVVSTASGTGLAKGFFSILLEPFLQKFLSPDLAYDLHYTSSDQSIIQLSRERFLPAAQDGKEQAIVLLSGDGGMIDIVNVLDEQPHSRQYRAPNVAVLPLGTGNALANSSSNLHDDTFGLRSLFYGTPKPLPTFRATFSQGARYVVDEGRGEAELLSINDIPTAYGAVVCSWGFHASLVADSDTVEYRKHGAERFQMAAKEALYPADGSPPHPYKGTVEILTTQNSKQEWNQVSRSEHGYILATLVSRLEAGFTISPSSLPLDGKLRLVHFGAFTGAEIMEIMQKAYQGGAHIQDERVHYDEIDGLRIKFDEEDGRWRRVCIDGKIVRVEKNGWVEVRNDVQPAVNLITSYA